MKDENKTNVWEKRTIIIMEIRLRQKETKYKNVLMISHVLTKVHCNSYHIK